MTQVRLSKVVRRVALEMKGLPRRALRTAYHFHPWHTRPASANPYVRDIVGVLNERDLVLRHSAVEIGCGLGDIIGHLDYERTLGLDAEIAVIRAARMIATLRRASVQYRAFSFPGSRLEGVYDAIVVVNWIHSIPPHDLRRWFYELFTKHLVVGGVLVFDTVADPEYRYNHSAGDLTQGLTCAIRKVGRYERGREVFVLERLPEEPA